jgi:hypothetical protein
MSRKARLPQTPRHVLIYDEDWEYLETRFGQVGIRPIGVSNVIRAVIHQKILDWREKERESMQEQPNARPTNLDSPTRSTT